ncbi:hypothetical protein SDC9_119365 [bioreactor metagenome]|uniref:Uncharacterized protein n=1 Tax=bioreactor metagenome TaxID=1076179 RepID=A0A645C3P1_9ZZZZ
MRQAGKEALFFTQEFFLFESFYFMEFALLLFFVSPQNKVESGGQDEEDGDGRQEVEPTGVPPGGSYGHAHGPTDGLVGKSVVLPDLEYVVARTEL